ncbi:Nuclear pore complex nucleoporin component [Coemansia sp. BCRC 34301]|nr:Nuclear pore complex nucleoporin component [Coemansia sp. BCRC 34301]
MRYGLFSTSPLGDTTRVRASTVAEPTSFEFASPSTREHRGPNGLLCDSAVNDSAAAASPLFDRKRRTVSTADHAPVVTKGKLPPTLLQQQQSRTVKPTASKWQVYGRRSLGVPLPVSSASVSTGNFGGLASASSAYGRGDRYRELVAKTCVKMRRVSVDGVASARSQASQNYAQHIQHELEETQRFLAQLSLTPTLASHTSAPPLTKSAAAAIEASIADTLNQVKELRKEYEEKRKAEEELQARQRKEKELEKQRKADEEKAKLAPPAPAVAVKKPAKPANPDVLAPTLAVSESSASSSRSTAPSDATFLAAQPPASMATAKLVSDDALEWATKYRNMYSQLMGELAPRVKGDKNKRVYCFKHRGTITKSIGQLKDSWVFVNRCTSTISEILAESKRHGADVHSWMLNLTAKAIVKQAEKEASIAQHAAYPLATTAVLIMQTYPQLADMLMIRLVKKCPYVIPQYFRKQSGQSIEDYLRSTGYKGKEDDELESENIYAERMAGMVALFAAIVQIPSANGKPNPFPISHGWTWIARLLNSAPRSISPLLVHTFLSVAGASLMAAYGKQFKKLLDTLISHWIPSITAKDPTATASKSNLCGYLEEYQKTSVLPECEGRVIKRS